MVTFIIIARAISPDVTVTTAKSVMENTVPVGKVRLVGDEALVIEATPGTEETIAAESNPSETDGKTVYESICVACHGTGIPGIPQLGDAAAWAPRLAQGKATLYEHSIQGFVGSSGIPMPAKGGNPDLSDEAVKAAVDYMLANSQ